jgi:erythromycin esterase
MQRLRTTTPAEDGDLGRQVLTFSSPLENSNDLDPLLERIGDARFVLLGEASHGTHEYYLWRARISRRLIEEKGFDFIAVEGDWPDCYRVNQYIRGERAEMTAEEVLRGFSRWPTWMWANWEIVALSEWLRSHNEARPSEEQVGFYGLDVYSLWESLAEVIDYLKEHHPEAVDAAYAAFHCFEPYAEDPQEYARGAMFVPDACRDEVQKLLQTIRDRASEISAGDATSLNAIMNAEALKGAEAYYRAMVAGGADSWNLRDRHMTNTLNRLTQFHGPDSKAIVWEHNTHIGDARYTDMARDGMFNVGQVVREEHGDDVVLVGFGSYQGTVIAGRGWDAPMEVMEVPSAMSGSWEQVLHDLDAQDRLLLFQKPVTGGHELAVPRGHRAIGVVYHPEFERGNYVPTVLPLRYDAFLYLDRTEALHPLHIEPRAGPPELYPWNV